MNVDRCSTKPTLLKKLRVKPEVPLVILNLPANCKVLFEDGKYKTSKARTGVIEQLIFFATHSAMLEDKFVPIGAHFACDRRN